MSRKRRSSGRSKTSGHQRQIWYFTLVLGGLAVLSVAVLLWYLNRPHLPAN